MKQIIIDESNNNHEKRPRVPAAFPFSSNRICISQYENKRFTHHWHSELEFTVIEKNGMDYRANDQVFHLREGDGIFVNSNVLHSAWLSGDGDCTYFPINMGLTLLRDFEGSDIDTKYISPIFEASDFPCLYLDRDNSRHRRIINLLRVCVALRSARENYYELYIKAKALEIWALICAEAKLARSDQRKSTLTPEKIADIKTALSYIREHYRENISIADLTRTCRMCKSEFSRCFRSLTQQTPVEYLQQYRIQMSLNLLADPDSRVTEVAAECGFSGPSYYAEIFRRVMGCSPLEYKKNHTPGAV